MTDTHRGVKIQAFQFPWTVHSYVDDEGDTIVEFADAPPNIHICAHGKNLTGALCLLNEIYEMYVLDIAERAAAPKAGKGDAS